MSHEIERVLRAAAQGCWFIEPRKAQEIAAMVALRVQHGPRAEAWGDGKKPAPMAEVAGAGAGQKVIRVVRLHGSIMPRGNMLSDMSGAVSLERFGQVFRQAAEAPDTGAIILDVDSPGGQVSLVPETVEMIRSYRREDRPIVAISNTMAASAAYWIAMGADELVVTPSGEVGSIGVYMLHMDYSERMKAEGVVPTFIAEGPRKVEGNPYQPLDEAARRALQADAKVFYDMFTADVAKARGVPVSVVRADPESAERHMGGGRTYGAREAVRLGMADRVETFDELVARLGRRVAGGGRRRRADIERKRLALI